MADFLVIGSGLAGLSFALKAARHGHVRVLCKTTRAESNTAFAQGGIAAVWSADDSAEAHVNDTLVAGAGLCRPDAVQQTVREAPERVRELIEQGVRFSQHDGEYSLHREGGHSARRILHADDLTGAELVRALLAAVEAEPNIELVEHQLAVDLVTENSLARRNGRAPVEPDRVLGAYVLDVPSGRVRVESARVVALCTGGAGKVYLYTSNPDVASGDGIAMAWRAGARIANMEFVQFHPTILFHPHAKSFLVSEVLRGEGGVLRLSSGEAFMARYDPRRELAPRDIVARAIDAELKRRGDDCVYLDMTHLDRSTIEAKFPNIDKRCRELGIDMAVAPIPVVPAAHYFCGGVQTDLQGESSVHNLFALGECACTGLHGANRLASNSLLEAVVFAEHAARAAVSRLPEAPSPGDIPEWDPGRAVDSDEQVVITQTWDEIRRFMWNYVGIVRTSKRLFRARARIDLVKDEVRDYYWDFKLTAPLLELRNLADVASLVVESAVRRKESRGLHYSLDYPAQDPRWVRDTVLRRRW
ncbi:MAG: L-aspartate oxidase [Deltaproteobacteria bacterium]|nr:L-aspartate oxidase [Deltaproteobacteria bacterium]